MGTNWLRFHYSAKVSAPEVMPLEGAVPARRVTHAVYFPTCVCVREWVCVRVSGARRSLWIQRDPLLTPQSIMCRCFCSGIGISACACWVAWGYDTPPRPPFQGYVFVWCWAACIGWSTVRVNLKSDQILGESALQCPLKLEDLMWARRLPSARLRDIPVLLLVLFISAYSYKYLQERIC